MYLRLVQACVSADRLTEYRHYYEGDVLSALEHTKGCLYAALARGAGGDDTVISITLWQKRGEAEEYERSGLFASLFEKSRPFFSDSSSWQLRLSEDLRLEYGPVPEEPVVTAYEGTTSAGHDPLAYPRLSCSFLRIVSMLAQSGKEQDFTNLYTTHILPELRSEPGCCSVQLAQSVANPLEYISFTVWESREAAERYESSGRFATLRDRLRPALSSLYQWKMQQEADPVLATFTSDDVSVHRYSVIVARAFRR